MAQYVLQYDSDDPGTYDAQDLHQQYHLARQWGLSAAIDLGECDRDLIRSQPAIIDFTLKLCDHISMKRYPPDEDPIVVRFGADPVVTGYSMVQLIETSNITAHFAEDEDGAYLDIFSCKYFDPLSAARFAAEYFGARAGFTFVVVFRKARRKRK